MIMKTKDTRFETTAKMLEWQYKQIIGELQELQRHASDVTCPCRLSADLGENCLCKHSLGLFILAGETAAMDAKNNELLDQLATEANDKHEKMKGFLCQKVDEPEFIDWSRQWRKKLEKIYYYTCKVKLKESDLAHLFEKKNPLIRISGTCKDKNCNFKVTHTRKTEMMAGSIKAIPHSIEEVLKAIADKTIVAGNRTFAYGTTGLIRYEFAYNIVEGEKLVVSNNPFTFEPNSGYPQELQPRKRERAAAELQVRSIAAGLIPDILLIDFRSTDRGAPIIGPDKVVESGNGRVMALLLASRDAPEKFAEYKAALKRIAPAYALDPSDADKMKIPILVRERITSVDRKNFAQDCNAPVALEQSAIEKARTDAEKITVAMLQSIAVDEGQTVEDAIRSPANKPFVVAFLNKLPQNEQAKLLDAQGLLNSDGLRRIILAIFVATFVGDVGLKLAEAFFESTDPNVKNTLNGITGSLGLLAQSEGLILSGQRYADYSIGGDLAKAVAKFSSIKKTAGQTVSKYINQMQLPGEPRELTPFQERILIVLDEHSRSGKRIAGILSLYAQKVVDSAPPGQKSFMGGERYTKEELFESAVKVVVTELEAEREEARRKEEAKRRAAAGPAMAMAELFEKVKLRQQLKFMMDDIPQDIVKTPAPQTQPVVVPGQASISTCPTSCQVITQTGKKFELFDFQKEGVAWLKGRSYALLADDMGLGKTPQGIWWGADRRPCLVITPANAIYNWQKEIQKMWRPNDSVIVFDGDVAFPKDLPDWCIFTYEGMSKYLPYIIKAGFKTVIVDEAHNVKNMDAKRTKNLLNLVAPQEPEPGDKIIPNRLAITGTPIMNRPIELFALLVFLGVKNRSDYRDFMKTYTESKEIKGRTVFTGAKNLTQLHEYLKGFMLRRMKKDVLKNLPPKTISPMFVGITNRDVYIEAERNFLKWVAENKGALAAANAAKAELIAKMNELRRLAAEGKVQPVADWLKPCGDGQGKVIVLSTFKEPLEKLAGIKGSAVLYTGETSKMQRQTFVDDFQETNNYCYFMGTIGAAGVAITLTAANRVCFLDLPWTPGAKSQAEDRAWRIGQKKPVEVVNVLAKGTIDERMLEILAEKEFIISQAIDGKNKDHAINDSIAMNLLDSYRQNPRLNENVKQYNAEPVDPSVNAVDADSLEILQGLNEEIPNYSRMAELFEKKGADSSKLRHLALAMQLLIDEKRNPAISQQNLTARRSRIASGMAADADYLEETQAALRGMADAIDAGTLPAILSKVTSRAQVEQILHGHFWPPVVSKSDLKDFEAAAKTQAQRDLIDILRNRSSRSDEWQIKLSDSEMAIIESIGKGNRSLEYSMRGFDEYKRLLAAGINSDEKLKEAKTVLQSYVSGPSAEVLAAKKKRELEASLIGTKIPGFFPTPRPVIDRMIEYADLQPGMSVLEPSAGKGDIADAVKEACPNCKLYLVEVNYNLIKLLENKGYFGVGFQDFMTWDLGIQFDRVLMNPPFENNQDVKHIQHAFDLLKPGGRLVAIAGEHCFFGQESACSNFRSWLEENYAQIEKLESGTFTGKEAFRQTGVASRLIVLDKSPASKAEFTSSSNVDFTSPEAVYTGSPVQGRLFERRKSRLLRADQISDFDYSHEEVIRRGNKCFIVDHNGLFADQEVEYDGITPEYEANIAKLTPDQRKRMIEAVQHTPYLSKEGKQERLALLLPAKFEILEEAKLADLTLPITKRLFPCNLSPAEIEKVLAWRPLRNFIAWAVGTGKAVQLCSIGLVPGVYQVTIKEVHDITDRAAEADKMARAIPTAKKVYSPADAVYEIIVPEDKETELSFTPQEVNMETAHREPAEQATMFERTVAGELKKSLDDEMKAIQTYRTRKEFALKTGDKETAKLYEHIADEELTHYEELLKRLQKIDTGKMNEAGVVKVTGQCQDNVKSCKFVVRKPKPGKKADYKDLPAAISAVEVSETVPVCSGAKSKKLERCILKVKKKGDGVNPFAVCTKSVGCQASRPLNEVPAVVQEAIKHPIEVKV